MRNVRAKEIAATGNRELQPRCGGCPSRRWRPGLPMHSYAHAPPRSGELVALGAELRQAQGRGTREDMRRVADRRRELIRELVSAASQSAAEASHSMGPQVQRQLEQTLEAAVADDESAAILSSGRLSSPLTFIGFGGAKATTKRPPAKSQAERSKGASVRKNESSEKRQAAERVLIKAAESRPQPREPMESAKESVEEARRRHNEAYARHRVAMKELRASDRDRARADQELEAALRNRADAEQQLRAAEGEHKSRLRDLV